MQLRKLQKKDLKEASATMMYGHVETDNDIVEHYDKIAKLQKDLNGFMAFIPWSFEPNNTLMQKEGTITTGAGGIQLILYLQPNLLGELCMLCMYTLNLILYMQHCVL